MGLLDLIPTTAPRPLTAVIVAFKATNAQPYGGEVLILVPLMLKHRDSGTNSPVTEITYAPVHASMQASWRRVLKATQAGP